MSLDPELAAERLLEVLEQEMEEERESGILPEMLVVKAWLHHVLGNEVLVEALVEEYVLALLERFE